MTAARLVVHAAGPGVTVQDAGRGGWARWGVTGCGAMDLPALRTALRALGEPADAAGIEVSLSGLEVEAEGLPFSVAVIGRGFAVALDGAPLPEAVVVTLTPGRRLSIRPGPCGAWAYLAVAGDIDLPPVLGSRSTHTRSHLGGLDGRALRAGDRLPIAHPRLSPAAPATIDIAALAAPAGPIRVVLGPQADHFDEEAIAAFLATEWRLSPRSDRMAYALEGPPLRHARGHDIVSDAVTHGSIQVPGSGLPFVLMADRQPTGGYPKIATVIGADLGRLAETRPGETIRFRAVSLDEAVAARRAFAVGLAAPLRLTPLRRADLTTDDLLAANLVSGVVDASEV